MTTTQTPVIIPPPPRPEAAYSIEYMNQLNRWMENLSRLMGSVSYLRGNGLYFGYIPTSGYGLKPGEVFANDGILTMVREDDVWAGSVYATGEVGTLTVTV